MCGIAGFYSNQEKRAKADILKRMLTRIKHRGPDQSGIYVSNEVCIGSVRLSIIDLKTGAMPLSNEDDSLWIVYNGEIFNYVELKEELLKKNHIFKTTTDTEVILHLYEEYGPECLKKLNGQFAIAIWDTNKKELFLARDRVGIRPLFYTQVKDDVIFASEIKSIFEYPGLNLKISSKALVQILTFWTTISPNTIFENVFEVKPGCYIKINSKGREERSYWELPICRPGEFNKMKLQETVEEFRELFADAVKIRLRADVPVGAYLSGGIDSSITTSFIRNISPDNLRTFSIGFSDEEFDETNYQNLAVDYFKTDHTYIKCNSDDIAAEFPDVVWHSEIPLLRTAPTPMYILSRLVRHNNVKVVITGEGADELLGGYNIFKEAIIRQFWAKDPKSKYRPLLLKKLYPYLPQMKNSNTMALNFFFGYKLQDVHMPLYSHLLRWNNTSRIKNYLSDDFKRAVSGYDPVNEMSGELERKFKDVDLLSRAQWLEINLFLSGYLLSSQGDRMAMANSVEGRYPFLDYRIIEFCMRMQPEYKLKGLNEKYLLKKMMSGKLPNQILDRSKQAYRAPILQSFRSNNSSGYIKEMFEEGQLLSSGIFNPVLVKELVTRMDANNSMSEIDNMAVTAILSTQILENFFVRKSVLSLSDADIVELDVEVFDNN